MITYLSTLKKKKLKNIFILLYYAWEIQKLSSEGDIDWVEYFWQFRPDIFSIINHQLNITESDTILNRDDVFLPPLK